MKIKNNRLIVVLGMHRSGTSAITRGLQVLGVSLGETLHGPMAGVNDKGFWEDVHLHALDVEMLGAIESDWAHVGLIDSSDVEILHKQGYFLRAVELLREKVSRSPIFAFKDPRVAKLLPFWKDVFAQCSFDVDYVLALRNPLSVVKSLSKRDGFDAEHSYLLWLGHVIASLIYSAGKKRVFVDYDRLMQSPDRELCRIAKHLELEIDSIELQNYKTEFLDEKLRHTIYHFNDLLLDNACPPIVHEIYSDLLDVTSDSIGFGGLESKVAQWSDEFERLKSALKLIDKFLAQKLLATRTIAERAGQIANLNQAVTERDGQIDNLNQSVTECGGQIANLSQAVTQRDGQIANLNQSVTERDGQIANLNQSVTERDGQISRLTSSNSWRLTKPLRFIRRIQRGAVKKAFSSLMGKHLKMFQL